MLRGRVTLLSACWCDCGGVKSYMGDWGRVSKWSKTEISGTSSGEPLWLGKAGAVQGYCAVKGIRGVERVRVGFTEPSVVASLYGWAKLGW